MSTPQDNGLPDGWKHVRFGDVVRQSKTRVDPETDGIVRYVAGQHMDTDDLRIRRWGEVGDGYLGPAFHRYFKPGQVLYGSRRTYLRKVAVADFEGVCANTTFVVESGSADLLDEFLPYVMTSETFHTYSISRSKGSTNPYINFSDLAEYEFALPPIDEQKRIVELLSSVDTTRYAHELCSDRARLVSRSLLAAICSDTSYQRVSLQEACKSPITRGIDRPGSNVPDGVPYIRVSDMTEEGHLAPSEGELLRAAPDVAAKFQRSSCDTGDIVLSIRASIGLIYMVEPERAGVHLTRGNARLSPDQTRVMPDFLAWMLRSPSFVHSLALITRGSTFRQVSLEDLRLVRIPAPPLPVQELLVGKLNAAGVLSRRASESAERARDAGVRLSENLLRPGDS